MYTVKTYFNGPGIGILTYTLSTDKKFYLATNTPMQFKTLQEAQLAWRKQTDWQLAPGIFVEGPRKGHHTVVLPYR